MLLSAVCDNGEKGVEDNLRGNPQRVKCWNIRSAMICEPSVVTKHSHNDMINQNQAVYRHWPKQ